MAIGTGYDGVSHVQVEAESELLVGAHLYCSGVSIVPDVAEWDANPRGVCRAGYEESG